MKELKRWTESKRGGLRDSVRKYEGERHYARVHGVVEGNITMEEILLGPSHQKSMITRVRMTMV